MWLDVIEYYNFYESELGEACRKLMTRKLRAIWPNVKNQIVAGYGYTTPFLEVFREEADAVFSLMPAPMGVMAWPQNTKNLSTLVEEYQLPFPDQSIDRLIVIHGMEHAERVNDLLREFWRTLSDGGRLLLAVPNRRGLWARSPSNPFGNGHSYTGHQLYDLVNQSLFTPTKPAYALHMPPMKSFINLQFFESLESLGEGWGKKFGGVVIIEAQKQILSAPRKAVRRWSPHVFVPEA